MSKDKRRGLSRREFIEVSVGVVAGGTVAAGCSSDSATSEAGGGAAGDTSAVGTGGGTSAVGGSGTGGVAPGQGGTEVLPQVKGGRGRAAGYRAPEAWRRAPAGCCQEAGARSPAPAG